MFSHIHELKEFMGVATNLLTCFLYRADKNRTFEDMYYMLEFFKPLLEESGF